MFDTMMHGTGILNTSVALKARKMCAQVMYISKIAMVDVAMAEMRRMLARVWSKHSKRWDIPLDSGRERKGKVIWIFAYESAYVYHCTCNVCVIVENRSVFGKGQIITRDAVTGVLVGGSDPRADGIAISSMA